MKKSELIPGMLVKTKEGNIYCVINDKVLACQDEWLDLETYNEDLTVRKPYSDKFEIVKVTFNERSKMSYGSNFCPKNWNEKEMKSLENSIVWEREHDIDWSNNPILCSNRKSNITKQFLYKKVLCLHELEGDCFSGIIVDETDPSFLVKGVFSKKDFKLYTI